MISEMFLLHFVASIIGSHTGHVSATDFGMFWQITDLHHDPKYSIHGNRYNNCHQQGVSADGTKPEDWPGMFGDPRCEAPWSLVESTIAAMKEIHPSPDFVLWTGGMGPVTYQVAQSQLTADIKAATDLLTVTFNETYVIPVLGNDDIAPSSQMPPLDGAYYQDILKNGGWGKILPSDAQTTFGKGGYYSLMIKPGLSLVVLNTNLYYTLNHLTKQMRDPAGMLAWLRQYLEQQRHIKHKVILAGHVPPGAHEGTANTFHMYPQFNQDYVDIVRSYSDVIGAQIFAHERNDTLRLFLGLDGKPINVGILAPSVSPYAYPKNQENTKANPGIRLVKYDRDNGNILDIFQYYLDLNTANKAKKADWKLEYQFTKAMVVKDLKPVSMHELLIRLSKDIGLESFHKLYSWNRISSKQDTSCVGVCRKVYLCAVKHLDIASYDVCMGDMSPRNETSTPATGTDAPTHPITNSSDSEPFYPSHPYHQGTIPKSVIYLVMAIGLMLLVAFLAVTVYLHKRRKLYPKVSYHRIPKYDYD
ncbi:acid sphingomyelinase-like phosphodiesterase 3b [Lineus longissimus]|uniref:acid sphingomyelinase-like phosphodiesterase 3b n=1 Tax=Lineus longissimus TaxID=88925 RepID=UPI002B4D11B1